jgi:purine nucleosidase
MTRQRVILDVDTGVDDALGIILAFRSPELEVLGITTVSGNAPVERTTANTLLVLEVLGAPEIPVVAGAARPLARPLFTAAEVHGEDGLGGIAHEYPSPKRRASEGASDFLLETLRRFPGAVTLIATGPLTNVGMAIRRDPETMRRLKTLTIMGGAIRVPGNVSPVTEFNFAVDPEAAAVVMEAGLDITLVPLDVTEQVLLSRGDLDGMPRGRPVPDFIRAMTARTLAFHQEPEGLEGMFLHDPLAVGTAVDPSLVRTRPLPVAVECQGVLTAGMTVADLRRRSRAAPTASVCVEVESSRFLELFRQRVLR